MRAGKLENSKRPTGNLVYGPNKLANYRKNAQKLKKMYYKMRKT